MSWSSALTPTPEVRCLLMSPIVYHLSCSAYLCSLHHNICFLTAAGLVELLNRPHIDKSLVPAHLPFQPAVELLLLLLFFRNQRCGLERVSAQLNNHPNQTINQIGRRFFLTPVALGDNDTVRNHSLPGSGNLQSPNDMPLIPSPLAPTLSLCFPTALPCLQPCPPGQIEPSVILDSAVIPPLLPVSLGRHVLLQRRGSRHLKLV